MCTDYNCQCHPDGSKKCYYEISYLDGSYTNGFLFKDFIRLGVTEENSVNVYFKMGCV